jgi:hypothetical protein
LTFYDNQGKDNFCIAQKTVVPMYDKSLHNLILDNEAIDDLKEVRI